MEKCFVFNINLGFWECIIEKGLQNDIKGGFVVRIRPIVSGLTTGLYLSPVYGSSLASGFLAVI